MVALVDLEEGARLVTNVVDVDPHAVTIGMAVRVRFETFDDGLVLPAVRPRTRGRVVSGAPPSLDWHALQVGDELPAMVIDVTPTRVVAGAIASRDFMPVHHDRDYANQQGAPDIFMNILSDTAYCSRFLTDWAGPDAMITNLAIRLGVPVFPGHTLTYTGSVTGLRREGDEGVVEVTLVAIDDLGEHVSGTATLTLPLGGGGERRELARRPGGDRRHRPDRVLEGLGSHRAAAGVRGGARRARRRRPVARRRSTASSPSRWTPTRRWRWPATSAWATSRCSAASTTAVAPRPPRSCTRRWPSPPGWPTWSSATGPSTSGRATASAT